MKIDSHQHFWKYNPDKHNWINAQMRAIKHDFMPKDLLNILQSNQFEGTVAVESSSTEEESDFLIMQANEHSFIKGIVGWVDLQHENIQDRLGYYSSFGKLKGFRHSIQTEANPDFLMKPSFLNGIAALAKHQFTFDILIQEHQLGLANLFVRQFPKQKFVIDHLAKPKIVANDIRNWAVSIKEIASNENVYCKISGFVTENDWNLWVEADFRPYFDVIFEAFGTKRLLFGSDWPICMLAASYSQCIEILDNYMACLSKNEQNLIWGENAINFYNLKVT
jgi:L-fuconolactonase